MLKKNKLSKLVLIIMTACFIIWIGGSILRSAIAFDLFEPGAELTIKDTYTNDIRMHSVYLYSMLASYTEICYGVAFLSGIFIFFRFRTQFKQRGWLLMAFILFFIACLIEAYLLYYDINLGMSIYWYNINDFNDQAINDFFIYRFKNVPTVILSGLGLLSSITSVILIIWRPLDKTQV